MQCESILRRLRPFFGHITFELFLTNYEELWSAYIASCREKHRVTHCQRYLLAALRRAHRKNWITKLFTKKDLPIKETHSPIGRALKDDERDRLLAACKKYPKLYLQVQLSLEMGLRLSEVLHLRKDEIDLVNREINLDPSRLKTRQPRAVGIPISDTVFPLLQEAYDRANGIFIFPATICGKIHLDRPQNDNSYFWKKALKEAGVKCRYHDTRHSAISLHIGGGMSLSDAAKIFGASRQVLEKIYFHVQDKEKSAFRSRLNKK